MMYYCMIYMSYPAIPAAIQMPSRVYVSSKHFLGDPGVPLVKRRVRHPYQRNH